MTVQELLERGLGAYRETSALKEKIDELEAAVCSLSSPGGGAPGSPRTDKYAEYVAYKDLLERKLQLRKRQMAAEHVAVILLTHDLPGGQRDAVRLRYCRGKSMEQIADGLHYTVRHAERLLKEAVSELKKSVSEWDVRAALPTWYMDYVDETEKARA